MSTDLDRATATDDTTASSIPHIRVAIVGTGFSGLGMAIRLKQAGIADFIVFERADEPGGTWRDNTYPGCACDVPSQLYSFSFAPNPNWSRRFSPQAEIWEYLCACANRFGVTPHIRYSDELQEAAWDDAAGHWRLTTSRGPLTAQFLILGNGPLSEPSIPNIPGLESFAGALFHSARWDHTRNLTGQRVAVIGTGASAIQFVPKIQPKVAQLTLFQRTPPWIMPRDDKPISPRRRRLYRRFPLAQRAARDGIYWTKEIGVLGLVYRTQMMQSVERQSRAHLAAQVADPALRAKLAPTYRMGCKRILLSDDFYPAVSQPNVEVITDSIREIRGSTIVTADGSEHEVDTIIVATGFQVTAMPAANHVCGRDGHTLAEHWRDGPQAYLGASVTGFPNLFTLIGPNTGLGHTSMVIMIEAQLAYVLDCLRTTERSGVQAIEVRPDAQTAYNAEMQRRMRGTVWTSGCASWYLDASGRNTTLWPGFTFEFRRRTRHFDPAAYALTAKATAIPAKGAKAAVYGTARAKRRDSLPQEERSLSNRE